MNDWVRVADAAAKQAESFNCEDLAKWCRSAGEIPQPRKADQDKMDSALCVLIAIYWRLRPREESLLLGDLTTGYMVLPASLGVRERLTVAARKCAVPVDGVLLS
jgi:predicted RNase H-like nuclease